MGRHRSAINKAGSQARATTFSPSSSTTSSEVADDRAKPEIQIKAQGWDRLCSQTPPQTSHSLTDSSGRQLPNGAFVLHDLFTGAECQRLISAAEKAGFGYTGYDKAYRGNLRLIATDSAFEALVWQRVMQFVPPEIVFDGSVWEPCGLNECWRLSKYYPGDKFGCHVDADFVRSLHERSFFTLNAYLNGDFEGGRTRFYDGINRRKSARVPEGDNEVAAVKGMAGMCLIFQQPPTASLPHDGEEVTGGLKYLLRSDVMYKRSGADLANADAAGMALYREAEIVEDSGRYDEAVALYKQIKRNHPAVAKEMKIV